MPYWVKAVVDYGGKTNEVQSLKFDRRDEAFAELAKLKQAQETYRSGSYGVPPVWWTSSD